MRFAEEIPVSNLAREFGVPAVLAENLLVIFSGFPPSPPLLPPLPLRLLLLLTARRRLARTGVGRLPAMTAIAARVITVRPIPVSEFLGAVWRVLGKILILLENVLMVIVRVAPKVSPLRLLNHHLLVTVLREGLNQNVLIGGTVIGFLVPGLAPNVLVAVALVQWFALLDLPRSIVSGIK